MKILHNISQSPDFTGSGKFIQELIRQSAAKGYENFLVAGVQADFKMPEELIPPDHCIFVRFDGKDLDFLIPGMSDVMPYPSSVFSKLGMSDIKAYQMVFEQKIRQAVDRFRPDILHTHHLWMVSALARRIAPAIPMVTNCHGTCLRQHCLCKDLGKSLTERLRHIDRIIALSRDQKQSIVETIAVDPSKITVISGGYNPKCFFYEPKSFNGVVELVYAGKLSFAKGVPWLLKSLERISDLPFRLHMAGNSDGKEKQICLELAEKFGKKAVYHGPLSHEHLADLMRQAHIFVLPSFFEGVPLVLMEALACGCRIVTTALPGVKEIFGIGNDPMVKMLKLPELKTVDTPFEEDMPMLEQRLAKMLKDCIEQVAVRFEPDMEYVHSTVSQFTWEKIFLKIKNQYNALCSNDFN